MPEAKNRMHPAVALRSLALVFLLSSILYSGFAYPLDYGTGFWPWNRDWFMFSEDTGEDSELRATAELSTGEQTLLDITPLFAFPVGGGVNRFQEIYRDEPTMHKLAAFLCKKFPARSITLKDYSWQRSPGRRLKLEEVPTESVTITNWVEQFPCKS